MLVAPQLHQRAAVLPHVLLHAKGAEVHYRLSSGDAYRLHCRSLMIKSNYGRLVITSRAREERHRKINLFREYHLFVRLGRPGWLSPEEEKPCNRWKMPKISMSAAGAETTMAAARCDQATMVACCLC